MKHVLSNICILKFMKMFFSLAQFSLGKKLEAAYTALITFPSLCRSRTLSWVIDDVGPKKQLLTLIRPINLCHYETAPANVNIS